MGRRQNLHDELKALLGTNNCWFQPPESIKLRYPCIIYELETPDVLRADDMAYRRVNKYGLTYITLNPDDPMIESIVDHFPMCRLSRPFTSDGLNHYYYDLYY